jgi:uncharacterized protein (DUF58 family)
VQVSPTFPTRLLTGLALLLLVAALFALNSIAFAWSTALILGLAVSRVLTQHSVARARTAGFEMLWLHPHRNLQTIQRTELSLSAELRNRSSQLLVLDSVASLCPPEFEVQVEPARALLPPHSSLPVRLTIRPLRVGVRGIQGLSVIVRSDLSAFEAQLTFANPFVLEVQPCATTHTEPLRRGGLGRVSAPANRTAVVSGQSLELRELREHQPGDALRKVAWKASARRGQLLVRDDEQEHRHLLWFVLDASVELWAGRPSEAALDDAINRVASMIRQALSRGDRVGLCIVAARTLARIPPDQGANHQRRLFEALARATSTLDADRSGLDEQDAAAVVLEHLRPIDPKGTRRVSSRDLDAIALLARRTLERSQLAPQPEPLGISPRDRLLRRYLAVFGLPSPPRTTSDRDLTDREVIATLDWLATQRPDRIRVCSPWPRPRLLEGLAKVQRRLKKSRIALDWIPMNIHYGVGESTLAPQRLIQSTLEWRSLVGAAEGKLGLRRVGIRDAMTVRAARAHDVNVP